MFEELSTIIENKYLFAIILFLFLVVFIKFILIIVKTISRKIVKKTKTIIDDQILERTENPLFTTLIIVSFRYVVSFVEIAKEYLPFLNNIIDSITIILITYTIYSIMSVFLEHYITKINKETKTNFHSELIPFAANFSKILFICIAFIFVLAIWNVDITPILAGFGIAGITIGLALQSTLSNIFGGMSLILDKNFNIGDEIKLDNELEGNILDVGLRSTKIRTKNNELLIVPNSVLATSKIINYAKPSTHLRIQIDFVLNKKDNVEKISKSIIEKSKKIDFIEPGTKPEIIINSIEEDKLKMKANFWINLTHINRNAAKEKLSEIVLDAVRK